MNNLSLLSLVLLLFTVSPLAAARPPFIVCDGDATYTANSTYEANIRRVAAKLTAAVSSASHSSYTHGAVGFWPNRVQASSLCRRRGDDDDGSFYIFGIICEDGGACHGDDDGSASRYSSCADCIAGAFRELENTCPYHREAYFSDRNCSLQINEVRMFGSDGYYYGRNVLKETMNSGLIFQAIGFAWLVFLLLQEWRGRKRGTTT